ncbi:MAG: sugar ABC transporter substrate-binding protein [Tepidisphaeraceae bacterium]
MTHRQWLIALLGCLMFVASGCEREGTSGPASSGDKKKLYWVQPSKGHPVHQLTQIAFSECARKHGYEPVIIGTDGPDVAGTVALAEQAIGRGDAAGMAVWTGTPAYNALIESAGAAGVPVVLPHFPAAEGSVPGARGVISCDPAQYAIEAATEIGKMIGGEGTVAVSQGGFNTTENQVAETFKKTLNEKFPKVKVLDSIEEGFDTSAAIAKASALMQSHPDLKAALSTTGGGAVTWANAQRSAGRKIVIVAMDYTRQNLDLVRDGEVHAVIGQPLWEESCGAAELLDRGSRGEKIDWWTKLPAPIIRKDGLDPYYKLLEKVEAAVGR